jgi:hypothetical protein
LHDAGVAATTVEQVRLAFPGRGIWEAHEGEPWTLVRVTD